MNNSRASLDEDEDEESEDALGDTTLAVETLTLETFTLEPDETTAPLLECRTELVIELLKCEDDAVTDRVEWEVVVALWIRAVDTGTAKGENGKVVEGRVAVTEPLTSTFSHTADPAVTMHPIWRSTDSEGKEAFSAIRLASSARVTARPSRLVNTNEYKNYEEGLTSERNPASLPAEHVRRLKLPTSSDNLTVKIRTGSKCHRKDGRISRPDRWEKIRQQQLGGWALISEGWTYQEQRCQLEEPKRGTW